MKIQLKPGNPPLKQKAKPIPHHLQSYVNKEIKKHNSFRIFRESTNSKSGLFVISGCSNHGKRQISQNCIGFKKRKR